MGHTTHLVSGQTPATCVHQGVRARLVRALAPRAPDALNAGPQRRRHDQLHSREVSQRQALCPVRLYLRRVPHPRPRLHPDGAVSAAASIRLCGSHAGVEIGADGPSQMALEDLAMMRAVHGSAVLYPSDATSAAALVQVMAGRPGISYLRTTRGGYPVLYQATEALAADGIAARVIDLYSVKPVDAATLRAAIEVTG